jgi:aminopeptidase-like protein
MSTGDWCFKLARDLWPINRSLTGPGVRQTLARLCEDLPALEIKSVPTGYEAFDWTVPDEWFPKAAYILTPDGERICDFATNNLHLMGYSEPVDAEFDLDELQTYLHSLEDQPDAIPYVTSYYRRRWGFCLTHEQRTQLKQGRYRVHIDTRLEPGVLNYGELILPGRSDEEIFLSTYVCHPSMANNELSGPVVTAALARWLQRRRRWYTYRIVFIPETIGSLVYLSKNLPKMKERVVAGFNITCVGDERAYSYLPSRSGGTLADRAALHALQHLCPDFTRYSWLDRGSDERQYCAPGIDLPMATIMRSKYGAYPEYHTSKDTLGGVVTPAGLEGGFRALQSAISVLEADMVPQVTVLGEPQLGKRGLYPDLSIRGSADNVRTMMNMISYCDGKHSLLDIAEKIGAPIWELDEQMKPLVQAGLITDKSGQSRRPSKRPAPAALAPVEDAASETHSRRSARAVVS